MQYFQIAHTEDGDTYIRRINPANFLKEIAEGGENEDHPFLSELPRDWGVEDWPVCRVVIRGEIIVPKPTVVVKAYEFPPE